MTKKNNAPTLQELKLAVINYHKGDENEYLRSSIARDACFTSFNSMEWKNGQMSDIKSELAELSEDGSEVVDIKVGRKIALYQRMEDELAELIERHDTDCNVYTEITQGEIWTPRPKRTYSSDGLGDQAELARILSK